MGDSDTADRDLVDSTLDEHRSCMQVVKEVEACLDRHADREGRWIAELVRKLPLLSKTLQAHFESEQDGPMFRKLPLTHPHLAGRLGRLESEHEQILESAAVVRRKADELCAQERSPQSFELHEINAQVQLLIAKIQRHEAEENEVVVEAHWTEVGSGD